MSRNRAPHIADVQIPDLPLEVLASALEDGLAAVGEFASEKADCYITFSDGRVYKYPDVPAMIALQLYVDRSEDSFQQIKYWPGYQRVS